MYEYIVQYDEMAEAMGGVINNSLLFAITRFLPPNPLEHFYISREKN